MQLIVNADDLGLDHSTTVAIIESLGRGICSSATLMATGEAFEEACELVHRHKLQRHVGIHISLTEGLAQSEAVRRENRLCGPDGRLRSSRTDLIWPFTWHQEAMFEEMLAQVRRCRRAGIPITHMDSHHHVHELWDVGRVAIRVAQAEGIAFIRLARNAGASTGAVVGLTRKVVNRRFRRAGLAGSDYFGSWKDYLHWRQHGGDMDGKFEIMVHPVLTGGVLTDRMVKRPMSEFEAEVGPAMCRHAVSFAGVCVEPWLRAASKGRPAGRVRRAPGPPLRPGYR